MTVTYQKQLNSLVRGYALLPRDERRSLESTTGVSPSVTIRFERTQTPLHGVKQSTSTGFSDQNQSRLVSWSNRDGSTRFPRQIGAALRSLGRHLKGKHRTLAFFRSLIRLKGVCMLDVTGPTVGYADLTCSEPAKPSVAAPTAAPRGFVRSKAAFRLQHAYQRYRARQPPQDAPEDWEDL